MAGRIAHRTWATWGVVARQGWRRSRCLYRCLPRSRKRCVGVVDVFNATGFVAVGLLVASVPVVRVVRVFAMGHEEMKVASGETNQAKRHDADEDAWCIHKKQCRFCQSCLCLLSYPFPPIPFDGAYGP